MPVFFITKDKLNKYAGLIFIAVFLCRTYYIVKINAIPSKYHSHYLSTPYKNMWLLNFILTRLLNNMYYFRTHIRSMWHNQPQSLLFESGLILKIRFAFFLKCFSTRQFYEFSFMFVPFCQTAHHFNEFMPRFLYQLVYITNCTCVIGYTAQIYERM